VKSQKYYGSIAYSPVITVVREASPVGNRTITLNRSRLNRQIKLIDANNITTQITTYDEFGDLTGRKDKQSSSTIAQLDYTYNNNHQLTYITQSGVGLATQNIDFTYDKLSQYQSVVVGWADAHG
jgi:hypothetical protein